MIKIAVDAMGGDNSPKKNSRWYRFTSFIKQKCFL